jgi:hypothetical protein
VTTATPELTTPLDQRTIASDPLQVSSGDLLGITLPAPGVAGFFLSMSDTEIRSKC